MNAEGKREREDCAVDALIASALRGENASPEIDPSLLPELTNEEKAALRNLPADFIDMLWQHPPGEEAEKVCQVDSDENLTHDLAYSGSSSGHGLNRADELDARTKEEIERNKQKILERVLQQQREKGGSNG
jgi:hypothetical protein